MGAPPRRTTTLPRRRSIAGDVGAVDGDDWYATQEIGEPEHGGPGGYSVWYR